MWHPYVISYFNETYSPSYQSTISELKNSPLDILKERYAKGEIIKEELNKKRLGITDNLNNP